MISSVGNTFRDARNVNEIDSRDIGRGTERISQRIVHRTQSVEIVRMNYTAGRDGAAKGGKAAREMARNAVRRVGRFAWPKVDKSDVD